jgi:M6 family metalloprotease-like protein
MLQWSRPTPIALAFLLTISPLAAAVRPDLAEFRTVATAVTTRMSRSPGRAPAQAGYLGIRVDDDRGCFVLAQVEHGSPAERAGLKAGDVVREVAGTAPTTLASLRELLQSRAPGDAVPFAVLRRGKPVEVTVTLDAPSHPLSATPRVAFGVRLSDADGGALVDAVWPDSPADRAGLRKDDLIVRADGRDLSGPDRLFMALSDKSPGDHLTLVVRRGGEDRKVKVRLTTGRSAPPASLDWGDRELIPWPKNVYRLAVVPIEFPDVPHNEDITPADWRRALFSRGRYTDRSPTGQPVFGSLNDYYREQSAGAFHVEGKVFPYVEVGRDPGDYVNNPFRFALLYEALDRLLAREGPNALQGFDGLFFVYAGGRSPAPRGSLLWPHRSGFNYHGRHWDYVVFPEGGPRMTSISVICHEFGHLLGLPDLYAQPEVPGADGLGIWCTMSTGHGRDGKPLHLCAWCKERLGWLRPAVIDPTVKQKLVLSPVEGSATECFKVPVRPDGSEYLLLENRTTKGFDRDLPGTGLLIWRVIDGRPVLEESHGIRGPEGPNRFLGSVPYPSRSNDAYTPTTTPSSRSPKGGGLPVNLTNIRRLPDGRITFWVGYEFL